MDIRWYLEAETGEPHFRRHGVAPSEVAEVLASPLEDRLGGGDARVAVGRTEAGRFSVVYFRDPQPESVFVLRPIR